MNINNYCFTVNYYNPDGTVDRVVEVKKVPRAKLRDLILLQQQLLDVFVEHDASIGVILSDEANWKLLETISAMLPIVGSEETLDIRRFEEDYVQICKVFFTESMADSGEYDLATDKPFLPSKISKLHQLNYHDQMGKAVERLAKRKKSQKESG
ncbi:MAG: hypothetical protein ACK4NC_07225 [Candidatus Gracilibacteria bacterium]